MFVCSLAAGGIRPERRDKPGPGPWPGLEAKPAGGEIKNETNEQTKRPAQLLRVCVWLCVWFWCAAVALNSQTAPREVLRCNVAALKKQFLTTSQLPQQKEKEREKRRVEVYVSACDWKVCQQRGRYHEPMGCDFHRFPLALGGKNVRVYIFGLTFLAQRGEE